ncbi:hypothetical protein F4677DRAFT_430090 [Hypoxylon crocopeplum]|nr:hypothetical protein F4677DRAFT_430090 [Hypoxylon crocopeplum]
MAASKRISPERLADLRRMYDCLCEWLNFDDDTKPFVRQILDSDFVKPFFREYRREYLEVATEIADIDYNELFQWCRSTNAFDMPKYWSSKAPSKEGWTALDHGTRFLVCVLRFSWENGGEWTHGKFDPDNDQDLESETEFYQVWAILQYLQADWEAANLKGWDASSLVKTFTRMRL